MFLFLILMKFALFVFLLFASDLASKYLINVYLENEIILTKFFKIAVSKNSDLAFSIPFPYVLQITLSFLLLIGLGIFLYKIKPLEKFIYIGSILIYSGAFGNLFERVFFKEVTDFIDFSFWPSFNFADVYIVIGAFLLLISNFEKNEKIVQNKDA